MFRSFLALSLFAALFAATLGGCSSTTSSSPYALTGDASHHQAQNPATYAAKDRIWLGAQSRN
ncbi:MAG: hypothetical protein ACTHN5_11505 [Phycisphaerae bacterium]